MHFSHRVRRAAGWAGFAPLAFALAVSSSCTRLESSDADDAGSGGSTTANGGGPGGSPQTGSEGGTTNGNPGDMVVNLDASMDVAKMACTNAAISDPYAPGYTAGSEKTTAESEVSSMSVANMATLMAGIVPACMNPNYNNFSTPGASGAQGLQLRDGPRGVNLIATSGAQCSNYWSCGGSNDSTVFPSGSARGATFDLALEQQIGAAMGDEMTAAGLDVILAPVINILRHPAWGRSQETYGEDSYLLGRMGSAYVSGVQQYVPACVKHFAGYNIENGRTGTNPNIARMADEQTFYEIYGRHFEMVVQDGGVACVMAAYNDIQVGSSGSASPCTTNPTLLTQMLRTTFHFQGWVLSDWWAMPNGQAPCPGADVEKPVAQAGVKAGLDMELPWNLNYSQLPALVSANSLTQAELATSAGRIVQQQLRFHIGGSGGSSGLKTSSSTYNSGANSVTNSSHAQLAYQAALESMVLLQNNKNGLPIPTSAKKVAVIAAPPSQVPFSLTMGVTSVNGGNVDFANDVRTGDMGSSRAFANPSQSSSPLAGIQAAAPSGVTVVSGTSASSAQGADFVVVIAGLTPEDEGEDYYIPEHGDRMSFSLDDKNVNYHKMSPVQDPLIEAVAALGIPMAVVLEGGSVIDTSKWLSKVPAVVMAWYPGQQGGRALGDLLFGNKVSGGTSPGAQANFSGKLPVTWSNWNDYPTFSSGPGQTTVMDYYLGYRYFDKNGTTPTFPFGAGLSYTTFQYSNLQVPCSTVTTSAVVDVKVDVTNTGALDGDEVTYLFVSYPNSRVRRSLKELKGFHRATIPKGATVQITIPLRVEDLKYWDETNHAWAWENGTVNIMVGGRSDALSLMDSITVMN